MTSTAVLKAVTDISKSMNNEGGDKSAQLQALAAMSRDMQNNPQAAAMQKMFPQAQGAPGAPAGGAPQAQPMPGA